MEPTNRHRTRRGTGRLRDEGPLGDGIRLLLVRHGQTAWNAAGRIQGASDTALDATGLEQARRIAARLAAVDVAAVYTSDLSRAADTARIIWALQPRKKTVPLRVCTALREISYGVWEGKTRADLERTGWGRSLRRWQAGMPATLPPDAEKKDAAAARVDAFLMSVLPRHAGETVVVVAHGGTLRIMLCRLAGLPLSQWGRIRIANTGLSEVIVVPGCRPRIVFVNDTGHVEDLLGRQGVGPLQAR